MKIFIVANIDGNVISSNDGLEWSAPFNTGVGIGKVAVGPNKIVYAGVGGEGGEGVSSGLFCTSGWSATPTQVEGTEGYQFNEVRYLGDKFVAVGYENVSPRIPAFAYSEDGMNWTMGDIDPGYIAIIGNGNDLEFTDVGYNGVGYFIIGILADEGGEGENKAGGFYTTDLSQQLDESNFVTPENFPTDARQLVYAPYPEGGENFGAWSAFSDDSKTWWSTFNEDPSQPWSFITGWDLSQVLFDNVGLQDLTIAEATIGTLNHEENSYVVWMLSTTNGQIIWWPHVPAGPFVSVPNPYTTSIATIENLNPLRVTFEGSVFNNEKITVSDSSGLEDLNGTYFVKDVGGGIYELHGTKELDSPIDASSWTGSYTNGSATATLSHGTYIDALGYGDGKFFAGNDDEEVFLCSGFNAGGEGQADLVWVEVEDLNNSLVYWNDVEYGDFEGCSAVVYNYDLSPDNPETIPNYRYYGEGNMDTAIVINEDGTRRSIQRTGYFDYLDSCGNRKVVRVDDGETVTDAPEIPETASNPTGHPTFGQNDSPSIIEQSIPTGNPLIG